MKFTTEKTPLQLADAIMEFNDPNWRHYDIKAYLEDNLRQILETSSSGTFEDGYNEGHQKGYEEGYERGREDEEEYG